MHEPVTVITDLMLVAFAGWAWFRLRATDAERFIDPARAAWRMTFATSGIAALLGAISHGIGPELSPVARWLVWRATLLTLVAIGAALVAVGWRTAWRVRSRGARTIGVGLLVLAGIGVVISGKFLHAMVVYMIGLAVVAAASRSAALSNHASARRLLGGAIALSTLGGVVQALHIAPSEWFNHNDLFHVIQLGGFTLFYAAATRWPRVRRER